MRMTGIGSLGFTSNQGKLQADAQTAVGKILGGGKQASTGVLKAPQVAVQAAQQAAAKVAAKKATSTVAPVVGTPTKPATTVTKLPAPKPHSTAEHLQTQSTAPKAGTGTPGGTGPGGSAASPSAPAGMVTVTKQGTPVGAPGGAAGEKSGSAFPWIAAALTALTLLG